MAGDVPLEERPSQIRGADHPDPERRRGSRASCSLAMSRRFDWSYDVSCPGSSARDSTRSTFCKAYGVVSFAGSRQARTIWRKKITSSPSLPGRRGTR